MKEVLNAEYFDLSPYFDGASNEIVQLKMWYGTALSAKKASAPTLDERYTKDHFQADLNSWLNFRAGNFSEEEKEKIINRLFPTAKV